METLNQLSFARIYTQGRLQLIKDEQWDLQPEGFNNTIRWNLGHIFVSMESFVHRVLPKYEQVHPEWVSLFKGGTMPSEWKGHVPTNEELLTALAEQPERVKKVLSGKINQELPESMKIGTIHEMATVASVIQFAVWHEGVHAGVISAINNITTNQ